MLCRPRGTVYIVITIPLNEKQLSPYVWPHMTKQVAAATRSRASGIHENDYCVFTLKLQFLGLVLWLVAK